MTIFDDKKTNKIDPNLIYIIDQIRSIGLEGLKYAVNSYDKERYQRLIQIAEKNYTKILKIAPSVVIQQFQKEFGIVSPKIGADAGVINELNEILVLKRTDDHTWCLPCGWVNVGESPAEAAVREVFEETGIQVQPLGYIALSHKNPLKGMHLHHQINPLILMKAIKKETLITLSAEHSDYNWITADTPINWHSGHESQFNNIVNYLNNSFHRNILYCS